jgi:ATP-dependent exoDNAse (exonuclease V) alpha subunit
MIFMIGEMKAMNLTSYQQQVFDRIHQSDDDIITLRGFAGTGKTHTAVDIIKSYINQNKKVCVGAPTAAALGVIKSKLKEFKHTPIEFKTVASLLKTPVEQVKIGDMISYHLNEDGVTKLKALLNNVNAPNKDKVVIDTFKYVKVMDPDSGLFKPKRVKAYGVNKEELYSAFKNSISKNLKMSDIDTSPEFVYKDASEVLDTLKFFDLVIIDEMPMVNSAETRLIEKAKELAVENESKFPRIVFVGDSAQLQPVEGMINPYMKSQPDDENIFELTEILRSTNDIALIGKKIKDGVSLYGLMNNFKDYIHERNQSFDDFIKSNLDSLAEKDILLTFTNKSVDKLNKAMRAQKGYSDDTPIQPDEPIMVRVNARAGDDIIFANGEEFNIESVYEPENALYAMKEGFEFREARKYIDFNQDEFSDAMALVSSGRIRLTKLKSNNIEERERLAWLSDNLKYSYQGFVFEQSLKRLEEIASFNDGEIPVLHASFGYARTIHKSQGSEWNNVGIIMTKYELRMQSLPNLQYTALTRAQNDLDAYIING